MASFGPPRRVQRNTDIEKNAVSATVAVTTTLCWQCGMQRNTASAGLPITKTQPADMAPTWRRDTRIIVCLCVCCRLHGAAGVMYLSASAFEEALKKEQARAKELEDKFNEKIVEHSVSSYTTTIVFWNLVFKNNFSIHIALKIRNIFESINAVLSTACVCNVQTLRAETICPSPVAVRLAADLYVRPRTGPQSAHG